MGEEQFSVNNINSCFTCITNKKKLGPKFWKSGSVELFALPKTVLDHQHLHPYLKHRHHYPAENKSKH